MHTLTSVRPTKPSGLPEDEHKISQTFIIARATTLYTVIGWSRLPSLSAVFTHAIVVELSLVPRPFLVSPHPLGREPSYSLEQGGLLQVTKSC